MNVSPARARCDRLESFEDLEHASPKRMPLTSSRVRLKTKYGSYLEDEMAKGNNAQKKETKKPKKDAVSKAPKDGKKK